MKPNREEYLEEIFEEIRKLGKQDLRVGQIFSIIKSSCEKDGKDLFFIENDKMLLQLKKLNGG